MSNLLAIVDGCVATAVCLGGAAAARWMAATTRKLDRIEGIVAPSDDPSQRLDRRVDAIEQAHASHIAWHAGGGKPPLRTTHG